MRISRPSFITGDSGVFSAIAPAKEKEKGPPSLVPGDRFGRYLLEERIGTGGMGHVYRALDTNLPRKVALKVIAPGPLDATAAERRARFEREARAAAALDHPNAVAIYDVGEVDGVLFMAMELIEGKTLRSCLHDDALGLEARLSVLVDVARALAAAHRCGVIHRDVKPENVMVASDGRAKVLDFGIARRIIVASPGADPLSDMPTITEDGRPVGTPPYMAPEQLSARPLDGRCDQFSWGVLAYEVLARRRPFRGDIMTMISNMLTAPPPLLRESAPEVPEEVEAVILRTLAKAPGDRFPSMAEVIAALEPIVAEAQRLSATGAPLSSAIFSLSEVPARISKPPAYAPHREAVLPSRELERSPDRRRAQRMAVVAVIAAVLVIGLLLLYLLLSPGSAATSLAARTA